MLALWTAGAVQIRACRLRKQPEASLLRWAGLLLSWHLHGGQPTDGMQKNDHHVMKQLGQTWEAQKCSRSQHCADSCGVQVQNSS